MSRTEARRVVTRDDVIRGGCRFFLRHSTVDMDALALDLAVSRATLYRVVPGRDPLLADVLWRLASRALDRARAARRSPGVDGVLEITRHFCAQVSSAPPYQRFLAAEPDTAARVLLTAAGGVHRRAVAFQTEVFLDAAIRDGMRLAGDVERLAYLYVRITESALYGELLTGKPADFALAERPLRALLAH